MMQEMFLSAARPFYHSAYYFVWINQWINQMYGNKAILA